MLNHRYYIVSMVKLEPSPLRLQTPHSGSSPALPPYSGVARTSPLLGHSVGTPRLYELLREVQKLIGGSVGILPRKFRNFTASQVGSEAIYRSEVQVTYGKLARMMSV